MAHRPVAIAAICAALAACNLVSGVGDLDFSSDRSAGGSGADSASAASTSGSAGSATHTGDDCEPLAQAYCSHVERCSPFVLALVFGDVATCVSREALRCAGAVKAPGSTFDDTQVAACGPAASPSDCDDLNSGFLARCATTPGSLADGASCAYDVQCSSLFCRLEQNSACGTCAEPAPAGGACVSSSGCQAGLACSNFACTEVAGGGEPCTRDQVCAWNLICSRTCQPPPGLGDTCDDASGCDLLAGLFCNSSAMPATCSQVGLADAGQSCGPSPSVVCVASGRCDSYGGGQCLAHAADGAKCGDGPGEAPCLAPARCVAGTCTLPDAMVCLPRT